MKRDKEWAKLQKQRQKESEEDHIKWEEEQKHKQEFAKKWPETQIQRIISGWYLKATNATLPIHHIRPGLGLFKEEYDAGRIIRLNEQTIKRFIDYALENEGYDDLINRLLDVATAGKQHH